MRPTNKFQVCQSRRRTVNPLKVTEECPDTLVVVLARPFAMDPLVSPVRLARTVCPPSTVLGLVLVPLVVCHLTVAPLVRLLLAVALRVTRVLLPLAQALPPLLLQKLRV